MLKFLIPLAAMALATPALALGPIPEVPSLWPAEGAFDAQPEVGMLSVTAEPPQPTQILLPERR